MSHLRIGLAGLGVVGSAVARQLLGNSQTIEPSIGRKPVLHAISARNRHKDRGFSQEGLVWHDDICALAADPDIDVVIELMGGGKGSQAADLVYTAIQAGKTVITANKALLAEEGNDLAKLVEETGGALYFEAAVAGGISIVNTLKNRLPANKINKVYGILNGTCNYILTRMELEGLSFQECLGEAQALGFAEADPTFDIDGFDTAYKLSLLASLAFGTRVAFDDVKIDGIRRIELNDIRRASRLGYRIKLIGIAEYNEGGLTQRVQPMMIPRSSPLADVKGATNAVGWNDNLLGESLMTGPGAGGDATASAVLSDLASAVQAGNHHVFSRPSQLMTPAKAASEDRLINAYYLNLLIRDEPGAFACIANAMAREAISLASILQDNKSSDGSESMKHVTIITHKTTRQALKRAIDSVSLSGFMGNKPTIFAIEDIT